MRHYVFTCETAGGTEVWCWPDLPLCIARRHAEHRARALSRGNGWCMKLYAFRPSTGRDELIDMEIVLQ